MRDILLSLVNLSSEWIEIISCLSNDGSVQINFLEDLANQGFDGCILHLVPVFLATAHILIVVWVCAQQILEKDNGEVNCFSSLNVFNG
jgi:hypothetical protein